MTDNNHYRLDEQAVDAQRLTSGITLSAEKCTICQKKALYKVGGGRYCKNHYSEALERRAKVSLSHDKASGAFVPDPTLSRTKLSRSYTAKIRPRFDSRANRQSYANGGRIVPYIPVASESVKLVRKEPPSPVISSACRKMRHGGLCTSKMCTCTCHKGGI